MSRPTILAVVGARPNLMKIAPLLDEMNRRETLDPILVHTGQHYDERMSELFFRQLGIPQPDHYLGVGSASHGRQTADIMVALEPLMMDRGPDTVLVVGDVNSTMAASLVAAKLNIPIAHVEAGLRSFDRTMPEEVNRVVTDALADLLFTTEPSADENLRREGVPAERIHFVGNTMIDTVLRHREAAASLNVAEGLGLERGGYAVLTLHRPSNVDEAEVLDGLIGFIAELQSRIPIVFPVHPRTRKRLEEQGQADRLRSLGGLKLLEPLGYLEFLGLMTDARLALTDSGGVQEETTILGVPCLTLRENTERPITVSQGTNRVVGTDPAALQRAAGEALDSPAGAASRPELWDGRAAQRIVDVLESAVGS